VVGKFCRCGILMRLAYLSKKAFEGFPHRTFDYQRSIHRGFPPSGGGILHLLLENERDLCLFIGLKTSSIFFSEVIGKLPNMFLPFCQQVPYTFVRFLNLKSFFPLGKEPH
jgi:hypothetical protein